MLFVINHKLFLAWWWIWWCSAAQ